MTPNENGQCGSGEHDESKKYSLLERFINEQKNERDTKKIASSKKQFDETANDVMSSIPNSDIVSHILSRTEELRTADIDLLLESAMDDYVANNYNSKMVNMCDMAQKTEKPINKNVSEIESHQQDEHDEKVARLRRLVKGYTCWMSEKLTFNQKVDELNSAAGRVEKIAQNHFDAKRITKEEYKELVSRTVEEVKYAHDYLDEKQLYSIVELIIQEIRRGINVEV